MSWVSGYFVFQLFNPVLFATEGAIVAGQMGMTLQVLTAIQSLSLSWLNTKVPLFSRLIALKDYPSLDSIFNKTVGQMSFVSICLLVFTFIGIWILNVTSFSVHGTVLAERFLPYLPIIILMIPIFLQQFTNAWATYLRCHKKEPYLALSVCSGIANGVAILVFGKYFGIMGITISYCLLCIAFFPWGRLIFINKKREWHGEVNYNNSDV